MSTDPHPNKNNCCSNCKNNPSGVALSATIHAEATTILRVEGMDCADEIAMVEKALKPLSGVRGVQVNLMGQTVAVGHDHSVTADQLIKAIIGVGLQASLNQGKSESVNNASDAQRSRLFSVLLSGFFAGIGLILQWSGMGFTAFRLTAFVLAIVSGGWFIFPKALSALGRRSLDMNVLMSVAVIGAAAIGEWSEAAAVVFLFAFAELLESFSVSRARQAIQSLLKLAPEIALLKRGNDFEEVPVSQVAVGSIIAIKSGSRVPLDGEVISGNSAVNQAPITGESMPVDKKAGDTVFAGSINGEGALEVRVTKAHSDTMLSRIVHLVEEAQSRKASSQRFVDVFARYYTPAVMVMAVLVLLVPPLLLGGVWATWIYRALVLLVIACPCALVISTPVSIVSGLTALARRGVLIKGGAVLESVGKLTALATDKTGTITEGKPRVISVTLLNSLSENEILRVAAAIDVHSEHPLAKAVVQYARDKGIVFPRAENYQAMNGRGAEGEIEGHHYFVGNHRFTHELAVCSEQIERILADIEAQSQSVIVVGHKPHADCKGEVLGVLAVGDSIRSNAAAAVQALHKTGIRQIVMLSGDNQRTVDAIARQVGIDKALGDLLPDSKVERVRELMLAHKYVGMIGDGVNDAPAMAAATVGIAMGVAGTDTAIETADMALMQDDLSQVAKAIHMGKRTVGVIKTNIAFALGVKGVFLLLALTGHTSLWLAILADTGATLIVVGNALRLLRD